MLSDEQIAEIQSGMNELLVGSRMFARAIEAAATEPLLKRIAELEQDMAAMTAKLSVERNHSAELEQELEAVRKDAERKHIALKEAGLFLHHAWCDIQMNDYSFEKLNQTMQVVDAAIDAAKERT